VDPDATPPYGTTRTGKPIVRIDAPKIEVIADGVRATWPGDPKAVVMFKEVRGGVEIGYVSAGAQTGQGPRMLASALRTSARHLGRPSLAKPNFLESKNVINKTIKGLLQKGEIDQARTIIRRSALFYSQALGGRPGTPVFITSGDTIVVQVPVTY